LTERDVYLGLKTLICNIKILKEDGEKVYFLWVWRDSLLHPVKKSLVIVDTLLHMQENGGKVYFI